MKTLNFTLIVMVLFFSCNDTKPCECQKQYDNAKDVTGAIKNMEFKNGINFIDVDANGYKLNVISKRGRLQGYMIHDPAGNIVNDKSYYVAKGINGKCYSCYVLTDNDGNVIKSECWEVSCKDVTSPPSDGDVK